MPGVGEDRSLTRKPAPSYNANSRADQDVEKLAPAKGERSCSDAVWNLGHDSYTWLVDLGDAFSFGFLFLLFSVMCLIKGFGGMFMQETAPFIYKEYNVPGPNMQVYLSSQKLPWSIKPAVGMMSDLVPIGGYRKFPYAVIVTCVGVSCILMLAFVARPSSSVLFAVACIMGFLLQVAFMDLMCQAKFAEVLKKIPQKGPDLVSFNWINIEVGSLFAVLWVGMLVAIVGPFTALTVLVPVTTVVFFPLLKGWFHETKLTNEDVAAECAIMMEQKPVFCMAIFLSVVSICLCLSNMLWYEPTRQAIMLFCLMGAIMFGLWVSLRPSLAMTNTYFMLVRLTHIDIKGATFYFFTDDESQFPEGPHFSPVFYVAGVGLTVTVLQLLAITTYNRFMKDCTYRTILLWPVFIHVIVSLCDLLLFTRYNLVLGIPDEFFLLGSTAVHTASDMWQFMPSQVMLAQLCPKGRLEATIFAILASSRNLGMTGGGFIGAFLLSWFEVEPAGKAGESAEFDNLWKVQLFVAFAPLLTIPLMWLLIPDARQTEKLIQDNEGSATHESLWERWNATSGANTSHGSEEVSPVRARDQNDQGTNGRRLPNPGGQQRPQSSSSLQRPQSLSRGQGPQSPMGIQKAAAPTRQQSLQSLPVTRSGPVPGPAPSFTAPKQGYPQLPPSSLQIPGGPAGHPNPFQLPQTSPSLRALPPAPTGSLPPGHAALQMRPPASMPPGSSLPPGVVFGQQSGLVPQRPASTGQSRTSSLPARRENRSNTQGADD